ncbi:cysteine hydrolase [Solimicrobium silvestre]|uniref:Amidases related to nicotinamidase n=1 Tax=Solimicrobium silvestre TaxID=2099400 RepID=A0A2S9H517_9BURK|nr:cysteine hydrolase [Solimicrobium silvestre]PRC95080.1 Amidases related to nicotinamidase [Solimicrobium silvestre]
MLNKTGSIGGTECALQFGKKTALVLIEYQDEWLAPGGKLNALMQDRSQFTDATLTSQRLIAGARAQGLPIIHVGLKFNVGYPELGKAQYGLREAIPRVGTFVGTGATFTPPFTPQTGEFVVSGRNGASAFASSNLDSYLRNQGIDTLLIAGFALHVCVESTLRQAHDLGYTAIVVSDATAAFTPEQRAHVLSDVVHHYGTSTSADAALSQLRGLTP